MMSIDQLGPALEAKMVEIRGLTEERRQLREAVEQQAARIAELEAELEAFREATACGTGDTCRTLWKPVRLRAEKAESERDALKRECEGLAIALSECVAALSAIDRTRQEPQDDAQRAAVSELRRVIKIGYSALSPAEPKEPELPQGCHRRANAARWRNDALEAAAMICERYDAAYAALDIRALIDEDA